MAPARGPLPNLTNSPVDPRFHIALPVAAQIEDLNHALSIAVKKHGAIKLAEKKEILLQKVSLLPSGNRLYLKINFEGKQGFWVRKVKGSIVCGAVPKLDASKQVLSFDEIDFTSETRDALSGSAAWLLKPVIIHEHPTPT